MIHWRGLRYTRTGAGVLHTRLKELGIRVIYQSPCILQIEFEARV